MKSETKIEALIHCAVLAGLLGWVVACGGEATTEPVAEAHEEGGEQHAGGAPADGAAHEEAAGDGEIHLSETQRSNLEIRVAPAGRGRAAATVSMPATVEFDPDRVARVGPRVQAKVVRVTADLGERVEAGEIVAVLDSAELGRAQSTYLTAEAAQEAAEAEFRRRQPLAEERIVSQSDLQATEARYRQAKAERNAAREELRLLGLTEDAIREIDTSDVPLSRYELRTPSPGVVQERDLTPGDTLEANETPILVVDSSVLWVMADAYEQALPHLAVGQPVTLRVPALPRQTFEGQVDWISSALDETTRTVGLRAEVANPEGVLRAGMFGTADVHTRADDEDAEYALVPVDAVQTLGSRQVVFVPAGEKGAFRAREVVPGAEGGGRVEIRRGLEPQEPVVVAGAFDLMSALTARERSAAHAH